MNERLQTDISLEAESHSDDILERSLGYGALHVASVENEPAQQAVETKESIKRPGGDVYAQDQSEYAPYVSQATAIIKRALWGDMSALEQIPNTEIRASLITHIETFNGALPTDEELEKMISVACGGLAPNNEQIAA